MSTKLALIFVALALVFYPQNNSEAGKQTIPTLQDSATRLRIYADSQIIENEYKLSRLKVINNQLRLLTLNK